MKKIWFVIALALAACGGGNIPIPIPPSPVPTFDAHWTTPNLGVQLWCEQETPVPCVVPPGTTWGTFNRPGTQGAACVDPNPNLCYSIIAGEYVTNPTTPGYPITTVQSFSKSATISVEAVVAGTCVDDGCWGGPVLYNGETNWRSIYFYNMPGGVGLAQGGPTHATYFPTVYAPGSYHTVKMIYDPAGPSWRYYIDGALLLTENPGYSADPTALSDDPHLSIFSGPMTLRVGRLQVFVN